MKNSERIGFFQRIVFLLSLCINESLTSSPKLSDNMIKMKAVKDKIFNGYDKTIRPTLEGSNTTEVRTGLYPRQILEIDEERGLFSLDSYFFMRWEDPRLAWNSTTEYNGYLQLPSQLMWLPDISVYNSHSSQVNPTEHVLVMIFPSGHVNWIPPVLTQTSCPELIEANYPDGIVTCTVILGAWVHDGWEIDYNREYLHMGEFVNINPRWDLIVSDVTLTRNITYYEGYEEPYLSLHANFPMRRRMPPEIEATRTPCILVMLLTLSIFWLPPNSSKKVFLGGILFLVLTILIAYAAFSTKLPLAVIYAVSFLQSTMYIVATTLLLQILVIFNVCNIAGPVRPPPAAMQLLTGPFGKYVFLRSSTNDNIPIDRIQLKEDSVNCVESPTPRDDWMLFAAGLDRLFFVIMSIAMIAIHHL